MENLVKDEVNILLSLRLNSLLKNCIENIQVLPEDNGNVFQNELAASKSKTSDKFAKWIRCSLPKE